MYVYSPMYGKESSSNYSKIISGGGDKKRK